MFQLYMKDELYATFDVMTIYKRKSVLCDLRISKTSPFRSSVDSFKEWLLMRNWVHGHRAMELFTILSTQEYSSADTYASKVAGNYMRSHEDFFWVKDARDQMTYKDLLSKKFPDGSDWLTI